MASPPSKTLHEPPPPIYPEPPLSPASGYFLIAWLYEIGKYQTQRENKEFSKPYESGSKLNPPGRLNLNGSKINLNLNLNLKRIYFGFCQVLAFSGWLESTQVGFSCSFLLDAMMGFVGPSLVRYSSLTSI
jgi:hypothetical protein